MMAEQGYSIPDPGHTTHLGNGWRVSITVDEAGHSWPWLLDPAGDHGAQRGCSLKCCAPHEQQGPLPRTLTDRIRRCGALTAWEGRPCRQYPQRGRARCWQHRTVQP